MEVASVKEALNGNSDSKVITPKTLKAYVINKISAIGGSLPPGGITGQHLIKQSSIDNDANWETLPDYEPLLPATPEDPAGKFLNGNKVWTPVSIGSGGYAANVYPTNIDSSITGYKVMSYTADANQVEKSIIVVNTAGEVLSNKYLFGQPVGITLIDAGIWSFSFRTKVSSLVGNTKIKAEVFKRTFAGVETTLFTAYSDSIETLTYADFRVEVSQPSFIVNATDYLGLKVYGLTSHSANITISTLVGGTNAAYVNTPIALRHSQLRDKNGEAEYQHMSSVEKTKLSHAVQSLDNTVSNIKSMTKAEYDALTDKTGVIITTDEPDTSITVIDNLTSTSTTDALSAAQGKYLYENKVQKGNLSWLNNLPVNFTTTPGLIGFTTKSIENGILTGNATNESFQTSLTCNVMINYNQAIAHSSTADSFHLELYADGSLVGTIASCYIPASVTATATFNAMVNLTAGVVYTLKIKANGSSGTHTPDYTYSTNKTNIFVVA